MSSDEYYVYVLARPNGSPFYVGKGKGNRINAHEREARNGVKSHKCHVIRKIWRDGGQVHKQIVFSTSSEVEAFNTESALIDCIGLEHLTNFTAGGGGVSGIKTSVRMRRVWQREDTRQKRIDAIRKANTPDVKARRGLSVRMYYKNNPDARTRQGEINKKRLLNPAYMAKHRQASSMGAAKRFSDPTQRSAMSEIIKRSTAAQRRYGSEEFSTQQRNNSRKFWNENPQAKQEKSASLRERWNDPAEREKLIQWSKDAAHKQRKQRGIAGETYITHEYRYRNKTKKMFRVRVPFNGKYKHIGWYTTYDTALKARNNALNSEPKTNAPLPDQPLVQLELFHN